MEQIEVEPIGCQAAEAVFAGGDRPFVRGVLRIDLADEKDFVAAAGDGVGDQFFAAAIAIHFGGVDQRQAQVEAQAERGDLFGRRPGCRPRSTCPCRGPALFRPRGARRFSS